MRRDAIGVHRWYDDAGVGDLRGIPAVAAYDAKNFSTDLLRVLQRENEVRANVLFKVPAAHGKNQHGIVPAEVAYLKPRRKDGRPALVVGAGG